MSADDVYTDQAAFAHQLRQLRATREQRVQSLKAKSRPRSANSKSERAAILAKTGGRCHICGGPIETNYWQADHVFAHSTGGAHTIENYLPAHSLCNNYRWHYDTEEFQWILKLGVWLRTQIESQTPIGQTAATCFVAHDLRRATRRRPLNPQSARTRLPRPRIG